MRSPAELHKLLNALPEHGALPVTREELRNLEAYMHLDCGEMGDVVPLKSISHGTQWLFVDELIKG